MTPEDLIADLRSRINPAYANQIGTESWERKLCADALEAQADEIERLRAMWETVQPLIDCRVCDHYLQEYMPCHLTAECVDGRGWTRTKVVKIYERPKAALCVKR